MKSLLLLLTSAGVLAMSVPAASRAPAAYEIELRMKGYGGLMSGAWCDEHADTNGYDVMTGVVRGVETSEEGEDITYRGTLTRKTKMDYCLVKPAPTEDQVTQCLAHLGGSARMIVEIEVYGEEGRGAWVKADSAPGSPMAVDTVSGNCMAADQAIMAEEYPGGGSAGSPSGQPIAESDSTPMFANGKARLPAWGSFPPRPPETLWGLKVIRRVP